MNWRQQKRKDGWWPTQHFRFVERDGHPVDGRKMRILQQLWNEILTGRDGVWFDVPLEDETVSESAMVEAGDPLGR